MSQETFEELLESYLPNKEENSGEKIIKGDDTQEILLMLTPDDIREVCRKYIKVINNEIPQP